MLLGHVALWTHKLETMCEFYQNIFGAKAGDRYENAKEQFSSYFMSFGEKGGAKLELMSRPTISNKGDNELIGYHHIAITFDTRAEVDAMTEKARAKGFRVESEPRLTGDGYYESAILDPDGNKVEIVVEPSE